MRAGLTGNAAHIQRQYYTHNCIYSLETHHLAPEPAVGSLSHTKTSLQPTACSTQSGQTRTTLSARLIPTTCHRTSAVIFLAYVIS